MIGMLGRLLWKVLLIALLAFGALYAINLYEEELTPEAKALLASPADPAPDKNSYFLYLGLAAPAGKDAVDWGQRRIRALKLTEDRSDAGSPEYAKLARDPAQKFPCRAMFRSAQDCVSLAQSRPAEISSWRAQHAEQLERYHRLRTYEVFEDAIYQTSSGPALPAIAAATPLHRATLMQVAALVEQGKAGEALRELQQEVTLHRRMLAGARTLGVKMDGADYLAHDILLLSLLLEERAAALAPLAAQVQQIAQPLSARELDLAPALRAEYASFARYLLTPARWAGRNPLAANPLVSDLPGRLFYKPRATVNLLAANVPSMLELAKVPPAELARRAGELAATLTARTDLCCSPHNPVGRMMANVGTPAVHLERVYDLEALIRLVNLQAQIVVKKVPLAQVPAFLAQSPADLVNPYTGKPMQFDAEKRQIYFPSNQLQSVAWFPERFGQGSGRVAVRLPQ